jgi:hypothetical protein
MIEHIFSVLCSGISIDAETNNISIFKVLEQLKVNTDSTEPIRIPIHFEILTLWTRQPQDVPCSGKTRITFSTPSDKNKPQGDINIDLSMTTNHRTRLVSDGIVLSGPGRYLFTIELQQQDDPEWVTVASLPLLVFYQPIQTPTVAQPE